MAGHGGRNGQRRAEQMRAHAAALTADEVAVRRRGDALAGKAGVAVHADAHRAPRLAPLEAGLAGDLAAPLPLRLLLDETGARDHPRRDHDLAALGDLCGRAQILDAAVGAGADEDT